MQNKWICTGLPENDEDWFTVGKIYVATDEGYAIDDNDSVRMFSFEEMNEGSNYPNFSPFIENLIGRTGDVDSESELKDDADKIRLELIQPEFIIGIGRVLTLGAKKYDANKWKELNTHEGIERIKGALLRHTMSYLSGEKLDPETGESHIYHISTNLMFLDYAERNPF